jgi:ribosomal protein S27E
MDEGHVVGYMPTIRCGACGNLNAVVFFADRDVECPVCSTPLVQIAGYI